MLAALLVLLLCCPLDGPPVMPSAANLFPQTAKQAEAGWQRSQGDAKAVAELRGWDARLVAYTCWAERCWDLLDWVKRCDQGNDEAKRRHLSQLRRLLGDDDYFAGRMPAPIREGR